MSSDSSRIDRRQFTGALATASSAALSVLTASHVTAAADAPAAEPKEEKEDPKPAAPPPEELLLLTCLLQRYPSEHFDDVAIQGIYRDIRGDAARGRILSEFPLKNSDEPFVFRAYRAREL